jgi:hypothetical protein
MLAAGALVAQARSPTLIESLSRPILGATGIAPDKPKSALALMQANLDWFSHYLPERAHSEGLAALRPR